MVDRSLLVEQNSAMPHNSVFFLLFVGASLLSAQQPASAPAKSADAPIPIKNPPLDPDRVAKDLNGSYYHPDKLNTLDCTLAVDWSAFFKALKVQVPEERMKTIQGLKINSHAVRGKLPELTFGWTAGEIDTKDQLEEGLKRMVGGFYQMYWSMIAGPAIENGTGITKVEPTPEAGRKVYTNTNGMEVDFDLDKDSAPTHYTIDSTLMKGTIDLEYTPSPNPVPGDLRRLTSAKVNETIGTSSMNVILNLDYQPAGEFDVPNHVSFDLVGAYSVDMEFANCTATKADASR